MFSARVKSDRSVRHFAFVGGAAVISSQPLNGLGFANAAKSIADGFVGGPTVEYPVSMGSAKQFLVVPTRPRLATDEMVAVPIRCFGEFNRVLDVKPSG